VKRALIILVALGVTACPRSPRPVIFAQMDREREKPHVVAAKDGSPTLFGKAEVLRARAEQAFNAGDSATAELLAHHALAAYHHAVATARLTAATMDQSKQAARLAKATEQVAADEAARVDVDREADRLEAEVAIRREALAPAVSGKTDPAREAARWTATRANLAVAEALCVGAQLLAPKAKGVDDAQKILAEVVAKAKNEKDPAPIDSSTRARALCLKALTNARQVTVAGGGVNGDALAKELTDAGLTASRDERGVVATLSMVPPKDAPFDGPKLTAPGKTQLALVSKIAKEHPTWAIVVVVHAAPGKLDAARDAARAKLVQQELTAAGVDAGRIAVSTPGASLLAHDPKDPKSHPKNERIEIVFAGAP
jgi:outer membrane protein OmpA-like peptidoglycan-associated protein